MYLKIALLLFLHVAMEAKLGKNGPMYFHAVPFWIINVFVTTTLANSWTKYLKYYVWEILMTGSKFVYERPYFHLVDNVTHCYKVY